MISKLIFSIITPVTQSFRNNSKIQIFCSKNKTNIIIIIILKTAD